MIREAICSEVNKNVSTGAGTALAISAISASSITPGPLGMADTSPIAEAPALIAVRASAMLWTQQILINGLVK